MNDYRTITHTILSIDEYDMPMSLSDFVENIRKVVSGMAPVFYVSAQVELDRGDDCDSCAQFRISYDRSETEEERASRVRAYVESNQEALDRAKREIKRLQAMIDQAEGTDK